MGTRIGEVTEGWAIQSVNVQDYSIFLGVQGRGGGGGGGGGGDRKKEGGIKPPFPSFSPSSLPPHLGVRILSVMMQSEVACM